MCGKTVLKLRYPLTIIFINYDGNVFGTTSNFPKGPAAFVFMLVLQQLVTLLETNWIPSKWAANWSIRLFVLSSISTHLHTYRYQPLKSAFIDLFSCFPNKKIWVRSLAHTLSSTKVLEINFMVFNRIIRVILSADRQAKLLRKSPPW